MADSDVVHDEDGNQITEGTVEAGIPPQLSDENSEINSSEESFSVSDLEEDFQSIASAEPSLNSSHDASEVTRMSLMLLLILPAKTSSPSKMLKKAMEALEVKFQNSDKLLQIYRGS